MFWENNLETSVCEFGQEFVLCSVGSFERFSSIERAKILSYFALFFGPCSHTSCVSKKGKFNFNLKNPIMRNDISISISKGMFVL